MKTIFASFVALAGCFTLTACGDKEDSFAYDQVDVVLGGPMTPAHRTLELTIGDAPLFVEVWYPTTSNGEGSPLASYARPASEQGDFADALADADAACARLQTDAIRDARPARFDEPMPTLVFSHCLGCSRFSSAQIAEELASAGFVVLAPDHRGNDLFSENPQLSQQALEARVAEVDVVLDLITEPVDPAEEDPLAFIRDSLDVERIGMYGHSFGSITTGTVAERDDRIDAFVLIAAPMDTYGTADPALVTERTLQLVMREDQSITFLGNNLIRAEFEKLPSGARIFEYDDAGHFGVSDICGINETFEACCGEANREQKPDETFTFADPAITRATAGQDITAFFLTTLLGSENGETYLNERLGDSDANRQHE